MIEFMQLAYHKKWVYDFRYLNNTDYVYSCLLSTTFYLFVCSSLAIKTQKWVLAIEGLVFFVCLAHFIWFEMNYLGYEALKNYLDLAYVELPLEKKLLNLLIFLDMNFILIVSYFSTQKRQKSLLEELSDLEKSNLSWLKSIIIVVFVQYNILMPTFLFLPKTEVFQSFSPLFFSMTYLFVFWKAFNKPNLFRKEHLGTEVLNVQFGNPTSLSLESPSDEEKELVELKLIFQKLDKEVKETESFLKPDFSIENASNLINEKRNTVSKAINLVYGNNFFTYVNNLRVEKAKIMLKNESLTDKFSIEGIGKLCGFGSRSGFFSVFKKIEGCTPNEYKQKVIV
ncbi:MAG: AraC family transcriptional regulator [Cytophagales bacterium]